MLGNGRRPVGVASAPDGTSAYVTNLVTDTVAVIDTLSNAVTELITLPPRAHDDLDELWSEIDQAASCEVRARRRKR